MNDDTRKRAKKAAPRFPIVGIGASAGGLKAAGDFIENTPPDTGMAFVLVFHLDPKHKSAAAEILQTRTRMPVVQVAKRTHIEPDHVYVIPPNHGLMLVDGELVLTEREPDSGRPTVIDHLFRSLAEHVGDHAIGVVLSGTGSEGSQGVKAIKEAGGLTVAQAEEDAEYPSMPHSAIATGLIDFVLPAAKIPCRLVEIKDFAVNFALPNDTNEDEADADTLVKIFVQLRTRVGHDFSHYKQSTVLRRITRRMQVHKLHDFSAYLAKLRETPAEAETLFRELLISVTNFFRDPDAMAALEKQVVPEICKRASKRGVRVWVPGCATGEEAYSLAMLLVESCDGLATSPRIQIFASDVDERALDVGRRGVYPGAITGDVSETRLRRFFDRDGDGFVVKPFLRAMVLFARHDLLQDPPFSKVSLISCRNLLIYLKAEIQTRIFSLFHFSLEPKGFLFLGSSESLGNAAKMYAELDRRSKIYQARRIPKAEVQLPLLSPREHQPNALPTRLQPDSSKGFEDIARDELLSHYAPPCVIVDESYNATYISGRVGKYLEPGSGVANYNILDMAREGLRIELRTALYKAFHGDIGVSDKRVRVGEDDNAELVSLTVRPLREADGHVLVVFNPINEPLQTDEMPSTDNVDDAMLAQLEAELTNTRESLQTSIEELETSNEELRASNEELQSVNEELQSTTEELETGKEELQSTNEELLAVNQELRLKNDELANSNGDLNNLIESTDIGTLFLDSDLRVRRYTPSATTLFNIIPGDIGRPFAHITHNLDADKLAVDAERVLQKLVMIERELKTTSDEFFQVRLRPYRTTDKKIGGVVLTFVDITERYQHEQETQALNHKLEIEQTYAQSIIATVREPMLVLDQELCVVTASRAFYRAFVTTSEATLRRPLPMLGEHQLDIPELLEKLRDAFSTRTSIDAFQMQCAFAHGTRALLLNASVLRQAKEMTPLMLLTLEDVTERRHAERHTTLLANIVDSSDDAIISTDLTGTITTWNPGAERLFGHRAEQAIGQSCTQLLLPAGSEPDTANVLRRLVAGEAAEQYESVRWHKDGTLLDVSMTISALIEDERTIGCTWIMRDISARRRADEHRQMLIHELNHRVKNTLATIQALATQTFRGNGMQRQKEIFEARLQALSNAHDVLTRESWRGAGIGEIIGNALAAWNDDQHARVQMHGPDFRLRPSAALALAMALHELATNASKYGALAHAKGRVSVRWSISTDAPQRFHLQWKEHDGPPVRPPEDRGFGSRLVEAGLAQDLGGNVTLAFDPDGVVCTVDAPLHEILQVEAH